jgi:hypothetical protein
MNDYPETIPVDFKRCPPCSGCCDQGRLCPAEEPDPGGLLWAVILSLSAWAGIIYYALWVTGVV